MKKLYLVLLLTLFSSLFTNDIFAQCEDITVDSLTNPGPFDVATLTEADGIRNGPDYFGATIYYPTNATPPFASIAIVPGFTALPSSVEEWGPFYASHGIVTIIIGTNSIYDFPEARAIALIDALETIKQENSRATSPLEGALNLDQLAVSGWSMGGGGAQRAAVLDNTIAGVVALCPYLTNPQLTHQSPVLIFSGENDNVAPPSQHADIHYDITPITTDKLLFEIANGNHSVANTPNGGGGSVGKIALTWLKLYVEENDCYCPLLTDELLVNPPAASKVEQDFECELLGVNSQELAIGFYPNPTKGIVNLEILEDVQFKLISPLGQDLLRGNLSGDNKQIDLSPFPSGMYFLNIEGQTIKLVKHN
ncbi:poly(ethylene terephthalate) hydrolase family protein [Ulvibacter antarcticus]|uniref:Putative secreted protein (Por secretion system target) n=1 Tax=Ulvibacter antarcticus TaxID=442714 RepID=A0A3L9YQH7_9FLAO|nr:T9SS type A sorting domain-containing protein [Ulvibacter antarcticus]RMA56742.1 putative secreted protein (Por secretion system target) [Ulvibacter antarcticus]